MKAFIFGERTRKTKQVNQKAIRKNNLVWLLKMLSSYTPLSHYRCHLFRHQRQFGLWVWIKGVVYTCSVMCDSFATPWTAARQAPLFMAFPRQECWSGLPFPPPGDLLNPEIEPTFLLSPALAAGFFTTSATWEATRRPQNISNK